MTAFTPTTAITPSATTTQASISPAIAPIQVTVPYGRRGTRAPPRTTQKHSKECFKVSKSFIVQNDSVKVVHFLLNIEWSVILIIKIQNYVLLLGNVWHTVRCDCSQGTKKASRQNPYSCLPGFVYFVISG